MNTKASLVSLAVAMVYSGSVAAVVNPGAYYEIEEIKVNKENAGDLTNANFAPFAKAISEDGGTLGSFSMRAQLSQLVDIGMPHTYEMGCFYDSTVCDAQWQGSENPNSASYQNAMKDWRLRQSNADNIGFASEYIALGQPIAGVVSDREITLGAAESASTDDTVQDIGVNGDMVGYSSAPYALEGSIYKRAYARRGFIKYLGSNALELSPSIETTNGGFSSAYKVKQVQYNNGLVKTVVVGSASVGRPKDNNDYYDSCYNSGHADDRNSMNGLVNCPGFDTQAWMWDIPSDCATGNCTITSKAMMPSPQTQWISERGGDKDAIYTGVAMDINASGVAVGLSTYRRDNNERGGRARPVYFVPNDEGNYPDSPVQITQVESGIDDPNNNMRHAWATGIDDSGMIIGNRLYELRKGRNRPTEFYVFNSQNNTIEFPLLDKLVQTKANKLSGNTVSKEGINSEVAAINNKGKVVGWTDDFDQFHPTENGNPRRQAAFIYDIKDKYSWYLNDLICTQSADGKVSLPLYRIQYANDINDDGQIVATAYKYPDSESYRLLKNAQQVTVKLSVNSAVDINNAPNCWESDVIKQDTQPYERKGASMSWLLLFVLPLVFMRKITKSDNNPS